MLKQALALEPGDAPEAIVHLSYYAMFHAATSVLLRRGFEPAKTHGGLIGTFGRLAKGLSQEAQEQGKALNRAEDLKWTPCPG